VASEVVRKGLGVGEYPELKMVKVKGVVVTNLRVVGVGLRHIGGVGDE